MHNAELISVDSADGPVELSRVLLPNKKFLYLVDDEAALALIQTVESGIFYILASFRPKLDPKKNNKREYGDCIPQIFKVTRNFMGSAILPATNTDLGLEQVAPKVYFNLPKIPWDMVQLLDAWFRKVDEDLHGSEAIVVLTFDRRFTDSQGWGFIVPTQENNAGHCRYDQESVLEIIPEEDLPHIVQVGTIHSHPGMSAFASHTDEQDQANFDGVHLTFGWPRQVTEYYAEEQIAGVAWELPLNVVFDMPPAMEHPNFSTWSSRVKKEAPPKELSGGSYTSDWSSIPSRGTHIKSDGKTFYPPILAPNPSDNFVIAELMNSSSENCPMCYTALSTEAKDCRRCLACFTFIAFPEETVEDLIRIRSHLHLDVRQLDGTDDSKPLKHWHRSGADYTEVIYEKKTVNH